jgi:hypothetical protein
MKRFILFASDYYYSSGGWNDFIESFDTLEEAQARCDPSLDADWYQIVDTTTGLIEAQGELR